jgi:hypothetical protein
MQTSSRPYVADEILIARIKLNEVWLTALAGDRNPPPPGVNYVDTRASYLRRAVNHPFPWKSF